MTLKECVKGMLKYRHTTQMDLAAALGLNQQSSIGNALSRGNMTVETLVSYCTACGYELVIQPNNVRGKRPEGQFVIDQTGPAPRKKAAEQ